jgi:hypothetical protein
MSEGKKASVGWAKTGEIVIADDAILLELKIGGGDQLLRNLALRKIAAAKAAERGITVSQQELQEALDAFCAERELFEEEQIELWRQSLHLPQSALAEYVRETVLANRLKEALTPDQAVNECFSASRHEYASAEVEVFGFESEGAAREFILSVREHETEPEGGESRQILRREAPEEIAASLFSAQPGEMLGPVETDDGFEAYRLVDRKDAMLDDELREQIRDELFSQFLEAELTRNPLTFLI